MRKMKEMLANEEESEISEEIQGDIRPSEEEEEMKREMIQVKDREIIRSCRSRY